MYNVIDILGYSTGIYSTAPAAHEAVLKQLPINDKESSKVLAKLQEHRVGANVWVSYGGASVLVKMC